MNNQIIDIEDCNYLGGRVNNSDGYCYITEYFKLKVENGYIIYRDFIVIDIKKDKVISVKTTATLVK